MKPFRRTLLILLAVIALVVSAVLVLVFVLPETDLIRSRVQKELGALTGQRVLLGSLDVSPAFPSLMKISIGGISIQTPDGKQLFSADRVVLIPGLLKLLRGEIHVKSVEIDRFSCQIVRQADGTLRGPLPPVPAAPLPGRAPPSTSRPPEKPRPLPKTTAPPSHPVPPKAQAVKWSIEQVSVSGGSVEWIDRASRPGQTVTITLRDIQGQIRTAGPSQRHAVFLSGVLGKKGKRRGRVELEGTVGLAGDLSRVRRVRMTCSAEDVDLDLFAAYLHGVTGRIRGLRRARLKVELSWDKGSSPVILFDGAAGSGGGKEEIDLEGKILAGRDFHGLKTLDWKAETDRLPLASLKRVLPEDLPLDPAAGVIKGGVTGKWSKEKRWSSHISFVLENAVPRGRLVQLAKTVRVWCRARLHPDELTLEKLDIKGAKRIATVKGRIAGPLSGHPRLNLTGEFFLDTRWLRAFRVRLPKTLKIKGRLPVHGSLRGELGDLWFDLSGDLTRVYLAYNPYLEKKDGAKGKLTAKGRYRRRSARNSKVPILDGVIAIDSAGTAVRVSRDSRWLPRSFFHLETRLILRKRLADLRQTVIALGRGSAGREIFRATGMVRGMGGADPWVKGSATALLDRELMKRTGLDSRLGVKVMGSSRMRASFVGRLSNMNWSLDIPLTHLDVTVDKRFTKPGGLAGSLKASGTRTNRVLFLKKADLKLPGLLLTARGELVNRRGTFGGVFLEVRKARLEKLLPLFPAAQGVALSGPVTAKILLNPTKQGVVPSGPVKLAGVSYKPPKTGWRVDRIKGVIRVEGDFLEIEGVTGRASGLVQGGFKVKGKLNRIRSVDTMTGKITLTAGKGRIKASRLMRILNQARLLAGTLLDPRGGKKGGLLEFDRLSGDFRLNSGTVTTDNLRFKGPDLSAGVIGSYRLKSRQIQAVLGLHTVIAGLDLIGKIPGVKDFVKKHKRLLEQTGVGKELKRFGITLPGSGSEREKDKKSGHTRTPVTIIVKLQGNASAPSIIPVLESALDRRTAARLKSLMR